MTDLHQGIVWGTQTDQTARDDRLINRFDYDGDYGTVLNRFPIQAAVDYPLTFHCTGRQTRAFIHIQDMARCIAMAAESPLRSGERVRIVNQMTETHRIRELAEKVSALTGTPVAYVANPRKEADANGLHVRNDTLLRLDLRPIELDDRLLTEVSEIAQRYRHRIDTAKVPCVTRW